MFVVAVNFRINPEYLEAFMPNMRENARLSVELEPGCHQFDVCTDPERPDEVFLYELYDDAAAFQHHLQSDHFKSFDAQAAKMIADKQVATYTANR